MMRLSLVVVLLLLPACEDPFEPAGAYPIEAPAAYRAAWAKVEECSGLSGTFDRVRWYAVPQTPFPCFGRVCRGVWVEPHNIYIAEGFLDESGNEYFTVRHEILHDLVQRPGHPEVFSTCNLLRYTPSDETVDPLWVEP